MPSARKSYIPKRRVGRPRKARTFKPLRFSSKKGYLELSRKMPEINMYNTSVAGVYTLTTQNCVQMGTPVLVYNTTYDIPFSMSFRLDSLINSTDLTNLCDQYKIKGARVKIYFNSNSASVGGSTSMPCLQYIVDHDDSTISGATVNALREKAGVKFKTFSSNRNVLNINLQPRVSQAVYNNGTIQPIVYAVPTKPIWINSAYPGVEHYGVKGVLTNVNLPASGGVPSTMFKFDVELLLAAKDFQ